MFNALNRNKRSVVLNLGHPDGASLFRRLAANSDIVIENFTPRVMNNFGLSFDSLRNDNPGLIMASLSGFGASGPWRDFVSFAFPTEAASGFPRLTGYPQGEPMFWGNAGADAIVGFFGAYAVLLALHHRSKTGYGQAIDLSQVEALTACLGGHIVGQQIAQMEPQRLGNGSATVAPVGCFRAAGVDQWIVVWVDSDASWKSLCRVLGRVDWDQDAQLASVRGRLQRQRELSIGIETWTRQREATGAMSELQEAGVAAGSVLSPENLLVDQHYRQVQFFQHVDMAGLGVHPVDGFWARLSETPASITRPAPRFGEHNIEVLQGILGCSDSDIAKLEAAGVTGTTPRALPVLAQGTASS
jgi:crotonobetainyl-CoA:carnitine CoA-transferase CaiB-like acyl-CoA transferase